MEFFNFPREIRDLIYEFAVLAMLNHKGRKQTVGQEWSDRCHCQEPALAVHRPHPAYFARMPSSCLVPDSWLYSVSRVSKRFANEIRPIFFQKTIFVVDNFSHATLDNKNPSLGLMLWHYDQFIDALGPEAKHLRRLVLSAYIGSKCEHPGLWQWQTCQCAAPSNEDAERELERLRYKLHPDIEIFLVMSSHPGAAHGNCYFRCRVPKGEGKAFAAEKLGCSDLASFREYLKRT